MTFYYTFCSYFGRAFDGFDELYVGFDMECIEKEFWHYEDKKSKIFAPLIVPIQCKLLEKVLLLVKAEDPEKPFGFNKLQLTIG